MFGVFQFGEPWFGDSDVTKVFAVAVLSGNYSLTGSGAITLAARAIDAEPGSYGVTGSNTVLSLFSVGGIGSYRLTIVAPELRLAIVATE